MILTMDKLAGRIRNADRHHFFCLDCKQDLTRLVYAVPQDNREHFIKCPRCKRTRRIDPALQGFRVIAQTRKALPVAHEITPKPPPQTATPDPAVAEAGSGK